MKRFFMWLGVIVVFAACVLGVGVGLRGAAEQPVASKTVGADGAIKVDRLFTNEGCTVYRFFDANAYRYYRTCKTGSGDVSEDEQ